MKIKIQFTKKEKLVPKQNARTMERVPLWRVYVYKNVVMRMGLPLS